MTREEFWQRAYLVALGREPAPFSLSGADLLGPRGTEIRFDSPVHPELEKPAAKRAARAADQAVREYDLRLDKTAAGLVFIGPLREDLDGRCGTVWQSEAAALRCCTCQQCGRTSRRPFCSNPCLATAFMAEQSRWKARDRSASTDHLQPKG